MKQKYLTAFWVASSAISAGSASQAQILSFSGANVEIINVTNILEGAYDYSQTSIFGSAEMGVGSNFAVQFDLGIWNYYSRPLDSTNFAIHGIYGISPNLTVGAYYGKDFWFGFDLNQNASYGIEAIYTPNILDGRIRIEALAGQYKNTYSNPANDTAKIISIGVDFLRRMTAFP